MRPCSGSEDEGTVTCQGLTLELNGCGLQVLTGACCSRCSQASWTRREEV